MSLICSCDVSKNRDYFYRGKYCIEYFCKKLKEIGTEIINYEKREMTPLTDGENKAYEKPKVCYIYIKELCTNENEENEFKKYVAIRCHYTGKFRGAAHSICNLRYKLPKEIPVIFHNGSTCDWHFIIKQLPEEFRGRFNCLGENTEKYITFSVPLKKEHDNGETAIYKIKFIDSNRFMQGKLSDHIDNLFVTNDKECKSCMERKNIKSECEFIGFKNDRLNYICKECKEKKKKKSTKSKNEAIKIFPIMYQFCSGDLNKCFCC